MLIQTRLLLLCLGFWAIVDGQAGLIHDEKGEEDNCFVLPMHVTLNLKLMFLGISK